MRQNHYVKTVDDVFESMSHGEVLTKFVAKDESKEPGDFSVEIHGFVTEQGELIVVSERVTPNPDTRQEEA